jgi:hypothetical protein
VHHMISPSAAVLVLFSHRRLGVAVDKLSQELLGRATRLPAGDIVEDCLNGIAAHIVQHSKLSARGG